MSVSVTRAEVGFTDRKGLKKGEKKSKSGLDISKVGKMWGTA
jgi:hypothetical protein